MDWIVCMTGKKLQRCGSYCGHVLDLESVLWSMSPEQCLEVWFSHTYQSSKFKVAVLAFDCVRGTCPSYFCGICTPLTEVGGRVRLRSAHRADLCVPSTRTEFGKRSFRVAAPRTWNSLPLHLHSPTISRQQFQSGLKLISSNAPTYDFYIRELLRSELTYLLTLPNAVVYFVKLSWSHCCGL